MRAGVVGAGRSGQPRRFRFLEVPYIVWNNRTGTHRIHRTLVFNETEGITTEFTFLICYHFISKEIFLVSVLLVAALLLPFPELGVALLPRREVGLRDGRLTDREDCLILKLLIRLGLLTIICVGSLLIICALLSFFVPFVSFFLLWIYVWLITILCLIGFLGCLVLLFLLVVRRLAAYVGVEGGPTVWLCLRDLFWL